ncbi:sulfonate ABC transporter substrate-binding protein [Leptolyngbya sp. FACHB-671]|uniref:sulfonate ABC transporter substrate-binding protein n=2 Tax=Cyanobacteriota TaxID=1117 RepID=UPI001682C575|nr:sulfonate ABC transporter substrate-binding protein [Leptolyngbya sp. FACHB-671]MBD2067698.1 sulfonate ABC transporter substrate-binding protein [Leptolyngbya sp. FACHB-671]
MFLARITLSSLRAYWTRLLRRPQGRSLSSFSLVFAIALSLSLVLSACDSGLLNKYVAVPQFSIGLDRENVIRLGHQKYGTLSIVRMQRSVEERLKPLGVTVRWNQFSTGPQLLEALNAGRLDFGHAGEAPPVNAQAAGASLLYVGSQPPNPAGEAILVLPDSPVRQVADLKGKRIAFNKGSNVHYFVVKALEKAGLDYSDIEPVFLPPADARAAFERKNVDAWAIWDPFFAAAQYATDARILTDGQDIIANREFFLSSQHFAQTHPDRLQMVLDVIAETAEWAKPRPREVAALISPLLGINVEVLTQVSARTSYGLNPITPEVVAYQQELADTFHRLKLIPNQIDIKQVAMMNPQMNQQTNQQQSSSLERSPVTTNP